MKLDYRRTFFVGLAFLSICAFWQMYDNIIPLMLKDTFGMKETVTGVVMAMDNVLALFLIPIFGVISDKVKTPLGKRTPFIVAGTIVAVISMTFIPIANERANLTLFLIFLGVVLLAMGSYRSPAVALMPDLTPKQLRSKANAIINLMGTIGGIYTLMMIKFLVNEKKEGYLPLSLSVSAIMIVAVVMLLVTIREKKLADEMGDQVTAEEHLEEIEAEKDKMNASKISVNHTLEQVVEKIKEKMPKDVKKSFLFIMVSIFLWFTAYNAVTTAYSRYAEQVWKLEPGGFVNSLLVATGAALLSYIPIGHLSCKIGRKKTIIGGIILMTVSYLCGALLSEYSSVINVIFAFTGIGWAAINVNSYPMVVEMCKGSDIGKYTGIYYIISMTAQIFTPILSGFLLENVSYRTLFPYAVFFSLASLCTMLVVKHGDSRPPKKANVLEHFDTAD